MLPPEISVDLARTQALEAAKLHAIDLAAVSAPIAEHLHAVQVKYAEARSRIADAESTAAVEGALFDWMSWVVSESAPPEAM